MALSNTSDPAAVAKAMSAWLPDILGVPGPVEVTDVVVPRSSGMSSETVLLKAAWSGGSRDLVLRIPAQDGIFYDTDLGREARVMTAVRERTGLPVAEVLAHEKTGDVLGSEFLLLTRVYGEVPGDDPPYVIAGWFQDLDDQQRGRIFDNMLDTLAKVATVDPVEAGLEPDLRREQAGSTVFEQELAYLREFYAWGNGGRPCPTLDRAFEIVAETMPADDKPTVLSWGDSRLGNAMFGPDQSVTGVFDWEMATLGRPENDLGFFLFCNRMFSEGIGVPEQSGFPTRAEAIARYEELSGRQVRDLEWFEAWGGLRAGVIVNRVANMMLDRGMLPPDDAMPFNNPTSTALAGLLGLPKPTGAAGWVTGREG